MSTPEIRYEKITIDAHGLEAVLAKGQELVVALASQMLELLKAHEAPNYAEFKLHDEDGEQVIVTIQKAQGQTPADQIKVLKNRVQELEDRLEDAYYDRLERDEKADLD